MYRSRKTRESRGEKKQKKQKEEKLTKKQQQKVKSKAFLSSGDDTSSSDDGDKPARQSSSIQRALYDYCIYYYIKGGLRQKRQYDNLPTTFFTCTILYVSITVFGVLWFGKFYPIFGE